MPGARKRHDDAQDAWSSGRAPRSAAASTQRRVEPLERGVDAAAP